MADAAVPGGAGQLRAFVAAPLPEEVKLHLERVQRALVAEAGRAGVRWVGSEGLHITLKFLGSTRESEVALVADALRRAVAGTGAFTLWFSVLGAFPGVERPRVVWVGATGQVEALGALQQAVERELRALGFPPESRPFSPHITLGRVREGASPELRRRLGGIVARSPVLSDVPPALVERIVLYRSTLTPSGAIYTPLSILRFP